MCVYIYIYIYTCICMNNDNDDNKVLAAFLPAHRPLGHLEARRDGR